jgi:hypothetical protein
MVAVRLRSSGADLVVVAGDELRDDLVEIIGRATSVTIENPQTWIQRHGTGTDLVVVAAGRNGALGTARVTKQAALIGATVVAAADRESVATNVLAAEALGVVTTRGSTAPL